MTQLPFVSERVLDRINTLPEKDREIISEALTCEFVNGEDPIAKLPPLIATVYTFIRFFVRREMAYTGSYEYGNKKAGHANAIKMACPA